MERGTRSGESGVGKTAPQERVISLRIINMEVLFYELQTHSSPESCICKVEGESEPRSWILSLNMRAHHVHVTQ